MEPLTWGPPPIGGSPGASPNSPVGSVPVLPSRPHLTGSPPRMAQPQAVQHNEPHLQRMSVNPGALRRAAGSQGTTANPRIKAEAILLTIHSCFSPKSIHNRTVKLMFPLLLQTIVKMIGIYPQCRARRLHPQAQSFWKGCMCEKNVHSQEVQIMVSLRDPNHSAQGGEMPRLVNITADFLETRGLPQTLGGAPRAGWLRVASAD